MLCSLFNWLRLPFCGLLMGCADVVPGISGGTMAFILGIYEELIDSIRSLNKKSSIAFLIPLLLGMGTAIVVFAGLVHEILNNPDWRAWLYSGFLGLILASIVLLTKQMKGFRPLFFLPLLFGAAAAWILTGSLKENDTIERYQVHVSVPYAEGKEVVNYQSGNLIDLSQLEVELLLRKGHIQSDTPIYKEVWTTSEQLQFKRKEPFFDFYAMGSGMVAISAMLLPGISGSYLLNVLGMYAPVLGAITDFSSSLKHGGFDPDAFWLLLSVGTGIGLGAALFSHIISWLLRHHHLFTLSLLTGFMIGALRSVWPFWELSWRVNPLRFDKGLELALVKPILPSVMTVEFLISMLFLIGGFALVFLIEFLANQRKSARCS